MIETRTCPRCSSWFATEQVDGEFSGICPRCLAGFMMSEPGAEAVFQVSPPGSAPSGTPLLPGARFGGFEILDVLGQGGMGIVYKARQTSLARTVALKVLAPQMAGSEEFERRFDREAKVLASLNHPNVVQVHDFGREAGIHYLVMEHVDGESLETALKRGRPDPAWLLRVLRDVAHGLRRVHEVGLVHRDLKPANILIARDGTAKIGDFGLAVETRTMQRLTEQGYFVGTPYYVSPEHAKGGTVDGRADLYAMGVILFEGFAGQPPFKGPSPTAVLVKHAEEPAPPLDAPPAIAAIVRRLLEKDPAKRFASASELEVALEAAADAPLPKRRRSWISAAAAALVLLGLLAFLLQPRAAAPDLALPFLVSAVDALRADKYDDAAGAAEEARLRGGDDPVWASQIQAVAARIAAIKADRAAIRAGRKGDDEEFGQFLCFSKGDWEHGLPMIAAGEESPYRLIAQKDLARPADATGRIAVAEGWLEAAGRADKARWGERMKERSWAWFSAGRAGATPAQKETIDRRLAELDAKLEARREIDLLRLANPGKFAVAGDFQLEGGRLRTPPTPAFARMSLPYLPPDEYDLEIVAERRTGEGALYVGLPRPGGSAGVELDASGRSRIDGTDVRHAGRILPAGKPARVVVSVRRDRINVSADGVPLLEAKGGSVSDAWRVPEKRLPFLGSDASAFSISRVTLRGALSLTLPDTLVDLLALIDPAKNAVRGAWSKESGALASPRPFGIDDLLQVPYAVPEEYDLDAVIERRDGPDGFGIALVAGGRPFMLAIDSHHGSCSGLSLVDGREANANETTYKGRVTRDGQPLSLHVSVRKDRLEVKADGRSIITWKADYSRCSQRVPWTLPSPEAIGLCAFRSAWTIRQLSLTPVAGPGRVLEDRSAAIGEPLNLLPLIDPERDAVVGKFRKETGRLLTPAAQVWARLQVPYAPPSEYDLRLVVERKSGNNSLNLGPSWGGRPCTIVIDGHGPSQADVTGLNFIDGKEFFRNETTRQGPYLRMRTPQTVEVAVRTGSISLTIDGQRLFEWKGHPSRLAVADGLKIPDPEALMIGCYDSQFEIRELTLTPRRAGGRVLPRAPAAIDLLARTDPVRNVVEGAWKFESGALVSAPAFSSITIPYEPPEEYDLLFGIERKVKDEAVVVVLPLAGRQVAVTFDSFGKTTGLDSIDGRGMGFTEREGRVLTTDREHAVRCSVRRGGVTVEVGGTTVIDWKGDLSRLSAPKHLRISEPRGFFLATWTTCRFSRMSLIEVTGRGRPIAAGAVDLMEWIDPNVDTVKGEWSLDEGTLVCRSASPAILQIPYVPPDEYDLTLVAVRKEGAGSLNIGLAKGEAQFMVVIDGCGDQGYKCGLHLVDGWHLSSKENETATRGRLITNSTTYTIVCSIRRHGLQVAMDGKTIIDWKGEFNRLANEGFWRVPSGRALFLGSFDGGYRISGLTLVPVSGEGRPLRERTVDLLPMIDPKKDSVAGTWKSEGKLLISDTSDNARLEIPYQPPAEYDFRIVFKRLEGAQDVYQVLSHDGKAFMWVDGGKSANCGFGMVRGKWGPDSSNPTYAKVTQEAEPGPTHTSVVQVRKDGVKAFLDGKFVSEWKTDYSDVAMNVIWKLRNDALLGIGSYLTSTAFEKVDLVEITGKGKRLR